MKSICKAIAWLCLLAMLGSAWAVASHDHASSVEAAKCSVCIAARSASPIVASTPAKTSLVLISILVLEPVIAEQTLVTFALRVRPPPEV